MEPKKVILPSGEEAVIAQYKEQTLEEYKGNPFIEALPKILSTEEAIDKLTVYPIFNENERLYNSELRIHCIQRMFKYFQPLENHLELQREICTTIRQGYVARNPLRIKYTQSFNEGHEAIINKNLNLDINKSATANLGFFLKGISGIGKTTAINRILSLYPQVIIHSKYKKINFSMYQLTWLKLDCPHDGSIKGLCIDFFLKIDNILGTNYYEKHGRSHMAANALIPIVAQVSKTCGLGVLIIDEIQHLSIQKSGGADKMLNFFVTLSNTIGIPVILIGTHKASDIIQSQFRQARRGCGQGKNEWNQMKKDINWKIFLDTMFDYQWTDEQFELTDELSDILYDTSQGITDIVLKVYAMAQIEAVAQGKKIITPSIIKKVAKNNLKLVKPMLDALRSGNIKQIHRYEDLTPLDIDEYCDKSYSTIKQNEDKKALQNSIANKKKIKENAMSLLLMLGVDDKKAKVNIENIYRDNPKIEVSELVSSVYQCIIEEEQKSKQNKQKLTEETNSKDENDLRYVTNTNSSNYDALKEKGYIKDYADDIL